jgi:competence protein ComEC
MKKRFISLVLVLVMCFAIAAGALAAPRVVASPQRVYVDGAEKSFQVYNIGGSNYFRLRDIAYVLSGTESKFSVVWDAGSNGISVTAGEDYTADGTEMSVGRDMSSTAVPSRQTLTINGEAANLAPYNIGGTNFFRLRELGAALSFGVSYDAAENSVAITSGKTAGNAASVTVSFIDVGQGDSVFIDDGTYEVLIDAGTADKGRLVSEYIKPYVDGDLDLVIATHAHADHVGGLTQVINDYKVDEIIDSGDTAASKAWQNYHAAAVSEQGCRLIPDCDMTVSMTNGASIQIIEALDGDANLNNDSVCALFTFGKVKVLLTGDSEEAAEAVIAKKVGDVDVFKAGHHGSRTANSMALLSAIKPEYVVVSCGAGNTYGHPHTQALENFASVGAVTYGTVKSGTVVMTTDGAAYSFNTSAALTLADAEDNGGAQ